MRTPSLCPTRWMRSAERAPRWRSTVSAVIGAHGRTVSVGNALQRDPALADAFVLTSPVTVSRRGGGTLAGLDVDGTKHRVLVISNEHDECPASPAYAGKQLAGRNHFDFVQVDSTEDRGDTSTQCGGNSPHGFLGIEEEVLGDINGWLDVKPVAIAK